MIVPLLEVKNLSVAFVQPDKSSRVIHDISFNVNAGETVAVVGESGSGKSVTSLSIMRLLQEPPALISGDIFFHSAEKTKNIIQLNDKQMCAIRGKDIAMIFQEPMSSLNPVLTCGFQLVEALQVHHKKMSTVNAKKRTLELFERVKLPDPERAFKSYPHQLSGGQIQRVMIAMAISCQPKLLIADEPTTALDVTVQKSILELLNDLKKEFGMSILFITHDLGVVKEIADSVIVMYKGRIVEENTAENIFSNPQHPYTKGLLACKPKMNERPEKLHTVSDFMEVQTLNDELIFKEKTTPLSDYKIVSNFETVQRFEKLVSQKPIFEIRNICIDYPSKKNFWGSPTAFTHAVNDVSFDIYAGETLGLVGESGCGKTSLGRSLINLTPITSGSVKYNNEELTKASSERWRALRRDIQIVFQDPFASLNPRITIGNAILEPLEVHKVLANTKQRREKVMQLLETVGLLPEHFNRYPHEFSGGQRQRICIARALALNPKFIIFDESVSALDVSIQAQVLNLLTDLRKQFNFTSIFISHDLSVVKFISDRIMVMQRGKIIETQAADALYTHPTEKYTQQLIEAIPH